MKSTKYWDNVIQIILKISGRRKMEVYFLFEVKVNFHFTSCLTNRYDSGGFFYFVLRVSC